VALSVGLPRRLKSRRTPWVLEAAGAEVVTMSSASAALQRLADAKADVIVVDRNASDGWIRIHCTRSRVQRRGYPGHSSCGAHCLLQDPRTAQKRSTVVSKCISRSRWIPANWSRRLRHSSAVDQAVVRHHSSIVSLRPQALSAPVLCHNAIDVSSCSCDISCAS
jgi:DNA-binding NarL/FixJ family response regulator